MVSEAPSKYRIRPSTGSDKSLIDALEARILPYRAQDALEVQLMFERAIAAEVSGDPCWMAPIVTDPLVKQVGLTTSWVAVAKEAEIYGYIGVERFSGSDAIAQSNPLVMAWQAQGRIAELRRLRVDESMRGIGVGTALCTAAIEWASEQGFDLLVVNTTSAQFPALQLYRKLGFQEAGISYVGKYELVWMELALGN